MHKTQYDVLRYTVVPKTFIDYTVTVYEKTTNGYNPVAISTAITKTDGKRLAQDLIRYVLRLRGQGFKDTIEVVSKLYSLSLALELRKFYEDIVSADRNTYDRIRFTAESSYLESLRNSIHDNSNIANRQHERCMDIAGSIDHLLPAIGDTAESLNQDVLYFIEKAILGV